jgi:TRAP-type C4-dicarboxylate transport system permease small subunit
MIIHSIYSTSTYALSEFEAGFVLVNIIRLIIAIVIYRYSFNQRPPLSIYKACDDTDLLTG